MDSAKPTGLRRLQVTLTLVLGVLPATLLVIFAVTFAIAGVSTWVDDPPANLFRSLIAVPMGAMGVAGYVALLSAAARPVTGRVALGLLAGVFANLYAIYLVSTDFERSALDDWYLYFPPLLIACGHLLQYVVQRANKVKRVASA